MGKIMNKIHPSMALKLHAYGLSLLHDPNWTGCILFDKLKQHVRGRVEPYDMLYKTLKKGLLYHLGIWVQEAYFDDDYLLETLKDEYRVWYLEDFVQAIIRFDEKFARKESITHGKEVLKKIDKLFTDDEDEYFEYLDSEKGIDDILECYRSIWFEFDSKKSDFMDQYALQYAERVFHDRQLCSYISELLFDIGFDGMLVPSKTNPGKLVEQVKWVDRIKWAEWTKKAIRSRDRGKCAECQKSLTMELSDDENIDHIVPLSKGGTNDLVNLQLLCRNCNSNKSNKEQAVKTSIPRYISSFVKAERKF